MKKGRAFSISQALQKRYPAPEWALFFEVRNQTGYSRQTRYADAMAFNMYPSRGQEIHGFEFKASRSDLLREIRDPDKSVELQKYCDMWWLVLEDESILDDKSLLPPTWGLLIPHPSKEELRTEVLAPKLKPQAVDKHLLCSVLRSMHERLKNPSHSEVEKARQEGYDAGYKLGEEQGKSDVESAQARLKNYEDAVSRFSRKTGIDVLRGWDPDKQFLEVFYTVQRLRRGRDSGVLSVLEDLAKFGRTVSEHAEGEIALLKQLEGAGDKGQEPESVPNEEHDRSATRSSDAPP